MAVELAVNDANVRAIAEGMAARVVIPALDQRQLRGRVDRVSGIGRDKHEGEAALAGVTEFPVRVLLEEVGEDLRPGMNVLSVTFGAGLTFTGHVVRWGQRVTPLGTSTVELPPNHQSALEIVQRYRAVNDLRVTA